MKRILMLLCAVALLCTLSACKKEEPAATDPTTVAVDLTDEVKAAILAWDDVSAYDLVQLNMRTLVTGGDTENKVGSAEQIEARCVPGQTGNVYYVNSVLANSSLPFKINYQYYYSDGWCYRVYDSPDGEEFDDYQRSPMSEELFVGSFDGIEPFVLTAAELDGGRATQTGDVVTVSVEVTDPASVKALTGDSLANLALVTQTEQSSYTCPTPVISYAVKDGALIGAIATFEFVLGDKVYTYEFSHSVNATGDAVQGVTLPEGADTYPIAEE